MRCDMLTTDFVLVSNQRDAAFVLLGLLSLYMFRARFVSIFRSNTQNCNGSHQCVSVNACEVTSYFYWYMYVESGYNVVWVSMRIVLCGGPPSYTILVRSCVSL